MREPHLLPARLVVVRVNLAIVRFCAEEVERQGRGPIEVAGMVEAWSKAVSAWRAVPGHARGFPGLSISLDRIRVWAQIIEPTRNDGDWRSCFVRVGTRVCPAPQLVPDLMQRWWDHRLDMTPAEAYREFEEIHPFADGNGRVGKIVFNWFNVTLSKPEMPPNFWEIRNP